MNKNDMLQQLQNLLGLKNDFCEEPEENESIAECVDELAEMFCDGAVILSRIADQIQRETDPWAKIICADDEDDEYGEDDDENPIDPSQHNDTSVRSSVRTTEGLESHGTGKQPVA